MYAGHLMQLQLVNVTLPVRVWPAHLRRHELGHHLNPFSGIIDAIDCTHVAIVAPPTEDGRYIERDYFNHKKISFYKCAAGNSGYPLEPWLITPIEGEINAGSPESLYNSTHSSTRNVIEHCNGLLKGRFRCLLKQRVLHYSPEKTSSIINACAVLHNMTQPSNQQLFQNGENAFYVTGDVEPLFSHISHVQTTHVGELGWKVVAEQRLNGGLPDWDGLAHCFMIQHPERKTILPVPEWVKPIKPAQGSFMVVAPSPANQCNIPACMKATAIGGSLAASCKKVAAACLSGTLVFMRHSTILFTPPRFRNQSRAGLSHISVIDIFLSPLSSSQSAYAADCRDFQGLDSFFRQSKRFLMGFSLTMTASACLLCVMSAIPRHAAPVTWLLSPRNN
uniref:DDE Tnp4 domain-containing protein n=1 Tax=Timema monikensis TaxID=170555 RepID=A0A7R9E830_9NEOP|nr:unnamed protein product [Timema monikensis]